MASFPSAIPDHAIEGEGGVSRRRFEEKQQLVSEVSRERTPQGGESLNSENSHLRQHSFLEEDETKTPRNPTTKGVSKRVASDLLATFLSVLFVGLARSASAAFVAWSLSGGCSEHERMSVSTRVKFFSSWTIVFWILYYLPTSLLEILLRLGCPSECLTSGLVCAISGIAWSLLIGHWMRLTRAIVTPFGVILTSVAGGISATLFPVDSRRRPSCRVCLMLVGSALVFSSQFLLLFAGLEGKYDERYAENARLNLEHNFSDDHLPETEIASIIAHGWMSSHSPENLRWSWEEAVAVEGLLAYSLHSGDTSPVNYVIDWARDHFQEAMTVPLWADAVIPSAPLLALHSRGLLPNDLFPIVDRVRVYLEKQAPRTRNGGLSHLGLLVRGMVPAQLWVDSLMMYGIVLNRMYEQGDDWAGEEAVRLGIAMVEALQDPKVGLFRHAWIPFYGEWGLMLPVEACFWARGNAWAAWFFVDHMHVLRSREVPIHPLLEASWEALHKSLRLARDEDGLWHTDLLSSCPRNPTETSASALIAAALRRSFAEGELEIPPNELNIDGLLQKGIHWSSDQVAVVGISTATQPGYRASYQSIPNEENVAHGVGALLLALCGFD